MSSSLRRAGTREVVLASLAGLLLLGAVYFALYGGRERLPTGSEHDVHFLCRNCGEFYFLTPDEVDGAMSRREFRGDDGRTISFMCKKCGQPKGQRAAKCPQHGEIVLLQPGPQDKAQCSQCDFRGAGG